MKGPVVVLDACVLIPIRLATTMLWLAETGMFQPLWSDQILDEVRRNLPRAGRITLERAAHRVSLMRESFGTEALVDGHEELVDTMRCDPKDRHVLAAAVHGGADAIVTFNVKDFPEESTAPHGVEVWHPDTFLLQLLAQQPDEVVEVLRREVEAFRNPPATLAEFLSSLTVTASTFANLAADAAEEPSGKIGPLPALVAADENEALAAFGEPWDLTDPAQVAIRWWFGLLDDLDVTRNLTVDPRAFGDYQWAVDVVRSRSLASKVLRAVDAPDRIAFMRFVPEVAQTSRVFEPYIDTMTFLTLVRLPDLTWRVWGLGPAMPAANQITPPPH